MIQRDSEPDHIRKANSTKNKRRAMICLLLLSYLIVANIGYNLWAEEGKAPIKKILTANVIYDLWTKKTAHTESGTVVGILYNGDKPCALINRELVYEGDVTKNVKIVKIDKSKVEFEKNGQRWTQTVLAEPNPAWKAKR